MYIILNRVCVISRVSKVSGVVGRESKGTYSYILSNDILMRNRMGLKRIYVYNVYIFIIYIYIIIYVKNISSLSNIRFFFFTSLSFGYFFFNNAWFSPACQPWITNDLLSKHFFILPGLPRLLLLLLSTIIIKIQFSSILITRRFPYIISTDAFIHN